MKKTIFQIPVLFAAFIAITFGSCTTSAQTSQNRELGNFSKITIEEGIKVNLTMGDKNYAEIEAPEDAIERVMTEIDGDKLRIYIKGNIPFKIKNIKINLTATTTNSIKVGSGASVNCTNTIQASEFYSSVSSGAHGNIKVEAEKIIAKSSSGAHMHISGKCSQLYSDASSGAGINGFDLIAQKAKADASSGAHIKLNVIEEIYANASSGGSIKYKGSPQLIDTNKSSGGIVRKD